MWPRGVTVSTLDPESSDRGSNPREAFVYVHHHIPDDEACSADDPRGQLHGGSRLSMGTATRENRGAGFPRKSFNTKADNAGKR